MFTAGEQSLMFTVKCKEQNMKRQVKLNLKQKMHIHACVAVPRKTLEAHKNLATMVVFGEGDWDTDDQGWREACFSLCTDLYYLFIKLYSGRRSEHIIPSRRHTNSQQTYEKMLNFTSS